MCHPSMKLLSALSLPPPLQQPVNGLIRLFMQHPWVYKLLSSFDPPHLSYSQHFRAPKLGAHFFFSAGGGEYCNFLWRIWQTSNSRLIAAILVHGIIFLFLGWQGSESSRIEDLFRAMRENSMQQFPSH